MKNARKFHKRLKTVICFFSRNCSISGRPSTQLYLTKSLSWRFWKHDKSWTRSFWEWREMEMLHHINCNEWHVHWKVCLLNVFMTSLFWTSSRLWSFEVSDRFFECLYHYDVFCTLWTFLCTRHVFKMCFERVKNVCYSVLPFSISCVCFMTSLRRFFFLRF